VHEPETKPFPLYGSKSFSCRQNEEFLNKPTFSAEIAKSSTTEIICELAAAAVVVMLFGISESGKNYYVDAVATC